MKIIYWISTTLIVIFLLWSAYTYLFQKSVIGGVRELGFPDFFRIQLAVLKLVAVLILLMPRVPLILKEWAYAGVGFFLLTAMVAHVAHRDSLAISLFLLVLFIVLVISRIFLQKAFL